MPSALSLGGGHVGASNSHRAESELTSQMVAIKPSFHIKGKHFKTALLCTVLSQAKVGNQV